MPPMPAEADAPPDLATPLTASAGLFGVARQFFKLRHRRQVAVDQIEVGELSRQQALVGEPGIFVFRRDARHRHRALGQSLAAVAGQVVGGDHRLAAADQHAQAEIVAFGAFRFFNRAVAHFDRQRHAAHHDGVGGIGAGRAGGFHQPFGAVGEGGLVEQGGCGGEHDCFQMALDGAPVQPADRNNSAADRNTSSIMVRNAPSIMEGDTIFANGD